MVFAWLLFQNGAGNCKKGYLIVGHGKSWEIIVSVPVELSYFRN